MLYEDATRWKPSEMAKGVRSLDPHRATSGSALAAFHACPPHFEHSFLSSHPRPIMPPNTIIKWVRQWELCFGKGANPLGLELLVCYGGSKGDAMSITPDLGKTKAAVKSTFEP